MLDTNRVTMNGVIIKKEESPPKNIDKQNNKTFYARPRSVAPRTPAASAAVNYSNRAISGENQSKFKGIRMTIKQRNSGQPQRKLLIKLAKTSDQRSPADSQEGLKIKIA